MTLYVLADYLSSYINDVFCLLLLWERRGWPVALAFFSATATTLLYLHRGPHPPNRKRVHGGGDKRYFIAGILPRGAGWKHYPFG